MFSLTRQEKGVLLFLCAIAFLGITINYLQKTLPGFRKLVNLDLTQQACPLKVNLNKADIEELIELPEIGPSLAQRIIAFRESEGEFLEIDELKKVKGIGERKFERLKSYIFIEPKFFKRTD